ncbi:MAG: DUF3078 domain-containing protein [Bacteroidales bacterium]|nr:DUF3078 domain-containing protein [Bacteroidales bacterium]
MKTNGYFRNSAMRRSLLGLAFVLTAGLAVSPALAQEAADDAAAAPKPWSFRGDAGLNVSQTALANWAAGGESSIAGNAVVNLNATFLKDRHKWESNLNTEYGLTWTPTNKLNKTVDKLVLNTQYGYALDKKDHWFISAQADFRTQYDKGYKDAAGHLADNDTAPTYISKIMAPGYLNVSVGVEYHLKKLLNVYVAPAVMRTTFVEDKFLSDQGAFGVTPGEHYLMQAGLQIQGDVNWEITPKIVLSSGLTLFTPYNKDFGNFVVDWDVLLVMKVTSWLNAQIGTTLKYDDKVKTTDKNGNVTGPKVQFREMLTIGLAYMFSR